MEPATPVPPPPSRRLGWLWLAVLGLVVGICAVVVQHRATLSSGPPGWTLSHPDIPVRLAALAASDMTPPAGWSLDSHGVLTAPVADASAVDVEAWIPQDGVLELVLEGGGGGASLVLRRGSPDEVGVFRSVRGNATARTPLRCQGALVMPAVGEVVSASLALAQGGLVATVGESQARCRVQKPLRGASARIGVGLRAVSLVAVGARGPGGAAMLRAPSLPVGMMVLAAVLGAGLLLGLGRTLGVARTAGLTLPLVLVLVLIQIDLAVALQAMRIVTDTPDLWALGVPLVGVGFFGMGGLSRALGRQERVLPVWVAPLCGGVLGAFGVAGYGLLFGLLTVIGGAVGALLFRWVVQRVWGAEVQPAWALVGAASWGLALGLGVLAAQPRYALAAAFAAEAGAVVGLVLWANVRTVRGFNTLSLVGVVLVAILVNQSLHWTELGGRLLGKSSRADAATADAGPWSSFEALEVTQAHTDYPDQDYPVAPSPRRAGAVRVIALGGSSTGGAWQNDDLDDFWPAELERRLGPGVQVVNQGVGGWTSFHIRRYLETRIADLDPDVLVIYIGHNDAMTPAAVPLAALFEAWTRRNDWRLGLSERLGGVPLYQLFRFGLLALVDRGDTVAVPPEDLDENINIIVDLMRARGGRVLLALEGIAPSPGPLHGHSTVMQAHVEAGLVAFVDTAAVLDAPDAGPVFLDACHLTARGHSTVAASIGDALRREGWVP